MSLSKETKLEMIRYLLGEAAPAEQEALEDRYAAEPETFEQLVAVENELADRYARGRLSASERAAFERHVLAHPQRRARVQFAAALVGKIDATEAPRATASLWQRFNAWWSETDLSFGLSLGLATATLLLAFFGWQSWQASQRLRGEVEQLRAAQQADAQRAQALQAQLAQQQFAHQRANDQLNAEVQQLRQAAATAPATAAPSFISFMLTAGLVRDGAGGDTPRLVIPRDTTEVRLRLRNPTKGYARYRLTLQTAAGRALQSVTVRAAATLALNLPARNFNSGEHVLSLSGLNSDGEADALSKTIFIVEKK